MNMKRIVLAFIFVLLPFICLLAQKTVVWENPVIGYTCYNYISITKVELGKEKTSLYMSIIFPSNAWFRISSQSFLETNGQRYAITESDSIELDKESYTPSVTWKKDFVLHFEPLPEDTETFDFREGFDKDGYSFFYIHPQGYRVPGSPVPADFLEERLEKEVFQGRVFGEQPATVHFKALNYKKGMNAEIDVSYFDITNPNSSNETKIYLDDEGCADFSCEIYYPIRLQFTMGTTIAIPRLAPGEEVTILIDMLRDGNKVIGYKGYLAQLNKDTDLFLAKYLGRMPKFAKLCEKLKTVGDIVVLHDSIMLACQKSLKDITEISDYSKKKYIDYELRFFSIIAEECDSLFHTQEFRNYVFRTRPECFYGDDVDVCADFKDVASLFVGTEEKGFGPDFCRFVYSMSELRSGITNPKPLIEDTNLSQLYDKVKREITESVNRRKDGLDENIHYMELIDVAPENTLQFLLDRNKGKVIMLDMWATWCGPCLMGHQKLAAVKEELKDKDIVYIYVTSSTSPYEKWKEMTADISGEHYYLSPEQFDALARHYNSGGGVPVYAIYNTKGESVFQSLGFSTVEPLKAGLLKALK